MDIFTQFCISRAPNKVEPTKFKVKALSPEERVHALSDQIKELTEEERRQKRRQPDVENQKQDESDDNEHHLDIYV